jgi:hypothetical protein
MTELKACPFVRLHPDDNTLVARINADEGTKINMHGGQVQLSQMIPMAHKIACRHIKSGDVVLKYGMPIGVATVDIAPGEHVHVHNVRTAIRTTVRAK